MFTIVLTLTLILSSGLDNPASMQSVFSQWRESEQARDEAKTRVERLRKEELDRAVAASEAAIKRAKELQLQFRSVVAEFEKSKASGPKK